MKSTTENAKHRKDAKDRKDSLLGVRLTKAEYVLLQERARDLRTGLATLARALLNEPPLPRILAAVLADCREAEGIEQHVLIERILWGWAKPHLKVKG